MLDVHGSSKSKSERKGMGRMIMMKNRFNNNSTNEGAQAYHSVKNGSMPKEQTPIKGV
eukprot:CAMPEP_0202967510 /NCGR_PEP_ID=MMETSP1396-20130829/12376_1 /ASSEMBLY_ACC=CAM_ASM_000872 /TAXON_ID= /ORGANISM="Pseudokeronopsis sp., Strain Brazil" /LENGTH=57 /DNA_ID=CAMNT_0049692591 /DNA_START=166 /DNA_END=339 /DNA_ORIENTATION=+